MKKMLFCLMTLASYQTLYASAQEELFEDFFETHALIESLYAQYDLDFQKVGRVMDKDVHIFNKGGLTPGLKPGDYVRGLLPHDQTTQENLSVEEIAEAFLRHEAMGSPTIAPKRVQLEMSFKTLVAHVKRSAVEVKETQLNVAQIFSRVWWLVLLTEKDEDVFSMMDEICQVMCDNPGGCYEGYAGRIAHLYITWMRPNFGF